MDAAPGGDPAAHFASDYVEVQGLRFATRRRAFLRRADGSIDRDRAVGTIDLSDYRLDRTGSPSERKVP